jgi:hypothetical protein
LANFNVAFMGPAHIYECRRDFILLLKYSLEELSHSVSISQSLFGDAVNLVIGTYFLDSETQLKIASTNYQKILVNTEVVSPMGLNFNPEKTDFYGTFLPCARQYNQIWDVIYTNLGQWQALGFDGVQHLPWAWSERLDEITPPSGGYQLDFYFYGMLSLRRRAIIKHLLDSGLKGRADGYCPYFQRNHWISSSKVVLNLKQDDKYSHVNSFRIGYLKNNRKCVVTEAEDDPYGYLDDTIVLPSLDSIASVLKDLLVNGQHELIGHRASSNFSQTKMSDVIRGLL